MKCDKHPDYGPLIMCSGCKDEQNTLRMRQAERIKELEHQLSCRTDKLSFRGNTVSYIYDKAKCYGNQLALAGRILSEHNLMDEFEERWNRVGSTKELSELQLAEQIAELQEHIKREESLGEDFASKYQNLKSENQRLKELLERAHEKVCSLDCPSVKKTGEPWPHTDLCKLISKALAAPPQKGE